LIFSSSLCTVFSIFMGFHVLLFMVIISGYWYECL
jgi:hypothetical protein